MQIILLLVTIYVLYRYGNRIITSVYGGLKSRQKNEYNALSFSLSAVLEKVTDRERILFRDNIDYLYRSLKKIRGHYKTLDLREITIIVRRADGVMKADTEVAAAILKVFEIIEKTARTAPPNLEAELTLDQIYIFLKDNI